MHINHSWGSLVVTPVAKRQEFRALAYNGKMVESEGIQQKMSKNTTFLQNKMLTLQDAWYYTTTVLQERIKKMWFQ